MVRPNALAVLRSSTIFDKLAAEQAELEAVIAASAGDKVEHHPGTTPGFDLILLGHMQDRQLRDHLAGVEWSTRKEDPPMNDQKLLRRITVNPEIFGGKPIIRGMRISVELILSLLAQGETEDAILADYPDLAREDIRACLTYAHAVIAQDTLDAVQVQ